MATAESRLNGRDAVIIIAGLVGVVFFWRGIWETSAKFISAEVSFLLGAGLLAIIALVQRKRFWKILS